MDAFMYDEDFILSTGLGWFRDIPEQYDLNYSFFLSRLYDYQHIDEIYDRLLQTPNLFSQFLLVPNKAANDSGYTKEEFLFNYAEFSAFTLAYYLLRYNGTYIYERPEIRKTSELLTATVDLLWEGKKLQLPKKITDLLRSIILGDEEFPFRSDVGSFLCQFFIAINDDKAENDKLSQKALLDIQYQINRINYRKTHEPENFDAEDFFRNYLPLNLFEVADHDFNDSTLFDNLIAQINDKISGDSNKLMETFLYITRLAYEDSFLSRIIKSTDTRIIEKQIITLNNFYNRALNPSLSPLMELYKFIEMSFILTVSGKRYFDKYPEHLKEITTSCTKFLNSMRTVSKEKLTDDEQLFRYDLCHSTAWFLSENYTRWKGVKPLLAIFRSSKTAWLNPNLSYKTEDLGWKNLALSIFHLFISKNADIMKQLRWDMAEGLAELLKPIPLKKQNQKRITNYEDDEQKLEGFDISLFEPNPHFRYAYVKAIGDLKIDTDGNDRHLHSILDNVKENDLSEIVRKAASEVYRELLKYQNKAPEENNNRLIIEAFWWIRYAHMKTLNLDVDDKTAREYRIFEVREYK
jgi:hypothetical protein